MSIPKGYPSKEREITRELPYRADHVTSQPVREKQIGNDVVAHMFMRVVGVDDVEADSTSTIINLTAHDALVGDVLRITSGNLIGQEVKVIGVTTDTVEIGEILSEAPATSDTVQILRHKYPIVAADGSLATTGGGVAEDSPFSNGDTVTPVASVRQDTLAGSVDTDGDYAAIKSNSLGEVYVTDTDANATLSAVQTAVEIIDNAISGNEMQVDVITSALPDGAATSANQATVISELQDIEADVEANTALLTTIDTTNSTIAGAIDGTEMQVDVVSSALPAGAATEATLSAVQTELSTLNAGLDIVDQIDTTPLLDTSSTNIPASSGSPVEVVASLAADVKKILVVEDIGNFIGIYTGAAASEVLKAVLPLGGGEVELNLPSGTRISLQALENTAISSGKIAINFLG